MSVIIQEALSMNQRSAHSDDTATTKAIIHTGYALLSGRASDPRDWNRWRALFAPGARLIPIEAGHGGAIVAQVMTPDEYITSRSPFFSQTDFFEWETARQEVSYGRLVHVWSSYEAAHKPHGDPIRKGVNSIQLWNDGARWWILSIAWDAVEAVTRAG
jgi:hypothetical protein